MSSAPICDFINRHINDKKIRFHMPGHKGKGEIEALDITEIYGMDSLYSDKGVILESEKIASKIFGSYKTCFSTEGSSQCIKAMLHLAMALKCPRGDGYVLAGRNAHSSFISASALLGFNIKWLYPRDSESYISCNITPRELDLTLKGLQNKPFALYITSPDYLGSTLDIEGISKVCRSYGVLLLVDNAHGAYLTLTGEHPIKYADMCTDSAHKTLNALTGAAYLHIGNTGEGSDVNYLCENAKMVMSIYGSTSPSFLTLASLDKLNAELEDKETKNKLDDVISRLDEIKKALSVFGFDIIGNEKIKLTLCPHKIGYTGTEVAMALDLAGISVEFFDYDFVTLMASYKTESLELDTLKSALLSLERKEEIQSPSKSVCKLETAMTVRETVFKEKEKIKVENALGRVFAELCVSCPPAVSIVVCGEVITSDAISALLRYGINEIYVTK